MSDKEKFLELMSELNIKTSEFTTIRPNEGNGISYDLSNNERIACIFNFNSSGEFIDLDCYN